MHQHSCQWIELDEQADVNSDRQKNRQRRTFNCMRCPSFHIAQIDFASCQVSLLPRWCGDTFVVCEYPGRVCRAHMCLSRCSAQTWVYPNCQRQKKTCRNRLTVATACRKGLIITCNMFFLHVQKSCVNSSNPC